MRLILASPLSYLLTSVRSAKLFSLKSSRGCCCFIPNSPASVIFRIHQAANYRPLWLGRLLAYTSSHLSTHLAHLVFIYNSVYLHTCLRSNCGSSETAFHLPRTVFRNDPNSQKDGHNRNPFILCQEYMDICAVADGIGLYVQLSPLRRSFPRHERTSYHTDQVALLNRPGIESDFRGCDGIPL